jgi:RIO-like serine/threonine protein kinase
MEQTTLPMTRDEVLALARERTTTTVQQLARAIGAGQNSIYDAIARDQWTATRVLRVGRKILIPTADIVALVSGDAA